MMPQIDELWTVRYDDNGFHYILRKIDGMDMYEDIAYMVDEDHEKEAELIVRAVNSHTALVSALEGLVGCPDLPDLIAKAEADGRRGLELKFSIIGLRQAIQTLNQNKAGA